METMIREVSPGRYETTGSMSLAVLAEATATLVWETTLIGKTLGSPTASADYLRPRLAGLEHEEVHVVWLTSQYTVIATECVASGTIDSACVYPREVVRAALASNAGACILAQNHPSGSLEPSQADIAITKRLTDALALVDVQVLDHLIIANGRSTSMAERGLTL